MIKFFKKLLENFKIPSEQERIHAYLSQAVDRAHLEHLEREYFRNQRRGDSNVALYK